MSELLKGLVYEMTSTLNAALTTLRTNKFLTYFDINYSIGSHFFHG